MLGVTLHGANEVSAPARSWITVVLPSGDHVSETGHDVPVAAFRCPAGDGGVTGDDTSPTGPKLQHCRKPLPLSGLAWQEVRQ